LGFSNLRSASAHQAAEQRTLKGSIMKSHTEYLWFNTKKQREFINITDEVQKALEKSQI